jgi:NodT family efflux transporter outer membrane factor (OMF) lipoprotein
MALGGCIPEGVRQYVRQGFKVGPDYARPPAPLAPAWIQADDPRTHAPAPRDDQWWEVFGDHTLNLLVRRAYANNPNLRAVGTRVLEARAQQAIAVGGFFPQSQRLMGLYPYGTAGGKAAHLDITAFNLSWELDFWGKYRRGIESANARYDASVEDYDAAIVSLLADVATNYVQYRVAQQRIAVARENLRLQEDLVAVAERQERVGTATALDVDQLRTLLEQTRSSIPALEILRGQANDLLCILLGEPPHDLEPELGPAAGPDLAPLPTIPVAAAAGIPAELLARRPDVRGAERQIAAQSAQIGVAKADFLPSVSVGTVLGQSSIGLQSLLKSSGGIAFIIPQFSWNIANYGRILNNVRYQDARTQELVATYQNTVLTAAREVQTALRAFLRSQEQAEALARSASAAVAATAIEQEFFESIRADVNRLFTLANARLSAQDQWVVARGNIALSLIATYRALGGGWQLRLLCDRPGGPPPFGPPPPGAAVAPPPPAAGGSPLAAGAPATPPDAAGAAAPDALPDALPGERGRPPDPLPTPERPRRPTDDDDPTR